MHERFRLKIEGTSCECISQLPFCCMCCRLLSTFLWAWSNRRRLHSSSPSACHARASSRLLPSGANPRPFARYRTAKKTPRCIVPVLDLSFKTCTTAAYDLCPMLFVVLFPSASIERPRNLGHCFAAFRSRFFFKSVRLQSLQQQLTTFRQMAQYNVVTKRRNAPSYLTRQLFLLSPVDLQKPHSAGSSCAAELVHIEIFMPDRCEERLPPPTLLARLSPDSDCAKVDLMKNRIFHTKLTVGFCFSKTTLC